MKNYIILWGKKIFVAIILVLLFFLWVAFWSWLGNPISNLNKSITVLQNDIITAEWYSAVNKRLGWAVSEWWFCKSIWWTINCLDTNTSGSGSENGWQEISLNNNDPFNRFCQYRTCDPKHIDDSIASEGCYYSAYTYEDMIWWLPWNGSTKWYISATNPTKASTYWEHVTVKVEQKAFTSWAWETFTGNSFDPANYEYRILFDERENWAPDGVTKYFFPNGVDAHQIWVAPIDASFDYWLTHANDKSKAKHSKDLNNWRKLTNLSMKCD